MGAGLGIFISQSARTFSNDPATIIAVNALNDNVKDQSIHPF